MNIEKIMECAIALNFLKNQEREFFSEKCRACNGTGKKYLEIKFIHMGDNQSEKCPNCNGIGKIGRN